MQSFTAMSEEGIQAVIDAQENTGDYPVSFNQSDFHMFVRALQAAHEHTADGGCPDVDASWSGGMSVDVQEWAADFLSSVADSLGIEFI